MFITAELEKMKSVNGIVLFLGEWCRLHARLYHIDEIVILRTPK
jgi:hypothetical protein